MTVPKTLTSMNSRLLEIVVCPDCGGDLSLLSSYSEVRPSTAALECHAGHRFEVVNQIPRFVSASNYADNFGYQWSKFRKTLLDSHTGHPIFERRFYEQSGWRRKELLGKRVLEVGCGAGPFTEIVLQAGAEVVSVDYSPAVDACLANHGENLRLSVVQGDIYRLPFRRETFDFIFCFGVLQHTPDVEGAFKALPPLLRPGGKIAVDFYRKHWSNVFHSKYWLRPMTTRIPSERLLSLVEKWVPTLLRLSNLIAATPGGRYTRRVIPVANYKGIFPLSEEQLREWAILDTLDWLGPTYDQPQTASTVEAWFRSVGLEEIQTVHPAHLTVRGRKKIPANPPCNAR